MLTQLDVQSRDAEAPNELPQGRSRHKLPASSGSVSYQRPLPTATRSAIEHVLISLSWNPWLFPRPLIDLPLAKPCSEPWNSSPSAPPAV